MSDQAQGLRKLAAKRSHVNQVRVSLPGTRIIAVTSGKGGVGKTNLTVNLSLALAKLGKRILLFDADLGLSNVDVIMGTTPRYTLTHILRGQKDLKDIVFTCRGIKIIAGGSGSRELCDLQEWQLQRFLEEIEQLQGISDLVMIDTGAGISRQVLGFVLAATDVIVVTTPEPTAITDAYALLKVIASNNNNTVVRLVVNRVINGEEARQVTDKLCATADRFLNIKVQKFGYIVEDPLISQAVRNQEPFISAHPKSPAALCVERLAERLLMHEEKTALDDIKGFFQRMFRLFQ